VSIKERLKGAAGRVIDIHTHIFDPIPEPSEERLGDMVRLARYYGIGRLVMLGNATGMLTSHDPPTETVADINTYTLKAMERYPEVFIGFCYLNPAHPPSSTEEEIERCVVQGKMRGIKLWVAVKATDSRLDPIMARAQELGVPVLHHTWYKATEMGPNESTPADLVDLAHRFPEVTVILAHLGGGRERGVLDIVDVPNLLYDTSGSQSEAGLVEYAVRRLGPERVVYGSDWPIRDFGTQIGRVLGAGIGDEEKELIFYGNAARLLGLEDEAG
jgi:predicted TIM-barrel fold metal-dependent hydrolase